jgi:hypothetical protein
MNDEMTYSVDTESIGSTNPNYHNTQNNIIHNVNDKGYHHVNRKKKPRGTFTLEYYNTSMVADTRIRNAVTGSRYRDDHPKLKYLVGTRQEDLFFKVTIANGENGNNPINMFYDNPEQFEKHQRLIVSQPLKEKWMKKNTECRLQNIKFCNRNPSNPDSVIT